MSATEAPQRRSPFRLTPLLALLLVAGSWSDGHAQGGTRSAVMRWVHGNRDVVARAAREMLTANGFVLEEKERAGKVGKARKAYANTPCEHLQSFSGEWLLHIDLNPRGLPVAKDQTIVVMNYEETQAVRSARRAEGDSILVKSDCLQQYVDQLVDSIQARVLRVGR
jgi:hypothetical protein